jgi:hypothetical protein
MAGVLPGGLAQRLGVAQRVAQVVGHLERLADAGAQFLPGLGVLPAATAPIWVAAMNSAPVLAR